MRKPRIWEKVLATGVVAGVIVYMVQFIDFIGTNIPSIPGA